MIKKVYEADPLLCHRRCDSGDQSAIGWESGSDMGRILGWSGEGFKWLQLRSIVTSSASGTRAVRERGSATAPGE